MAEVMAGWYDRDGDVDDATADKWGFVRKKDGYMKWIGPDVRLRNVSAALSRPTPAEEWATRIPIKPGPD